MAKIFTRYGDGTPLEISQNQLKADLEQGTLDAVELLGEGGN